MKTYNKLDKIIDRNIGVNPVFLMFKGYDRIVELNDANTGKKELFYQKKIIDGDEIEVIYCRIVDNPLFGGNWGYYVTEDTSGLSGWNGVFRGALWESVYYRKQKE